METQNNSVMSYELWIAYTSFLESKGTTNNKTSNMPTVPSAPTLSGKMIKPLRNYCDYVLKTEMKKSFGSFVAFNLPLILSAALNDFVLRVQWQL